MAAKFKIKPGNSPGTFPFSCNLVFNEDCFDRNIINHQTEGTKLLLLRISGKESKNLLVAPKEITKLFCSKKRDHHQKVHFKKENRRKPEMDYFQSNTDNASDVSDISQEESTCNQELLMPQLRARNNCYKNHQYKKVNTFKCNNPKLEVEERSINVGVRQTNINNHPTIVEHKIKVVKDKRLRMSLPSIENPTKNNAGTFYYSNDKESGDTLKGELSDFLTYPANIENIKIPRKRELHRIMHHRLCNYVNPDIVLVIDDHEFLCHRIVLQCYSKYFDEINNLSDEKLITIEDKGVSKQAFTAIYPWMLSLNESGLKYITRENFVEVFMASQALQIKDLEEQCLALMDSTEVFSEGHAYQLFKVASRHNQQSIKEMMIPRIQHFFLPFVSTQEFLELNVEDLCIFLSSSYIVVHSEMEVFMSGARWLLDDWNVKKQYVPKVMNCVRFGLMNPLELVDIRKNPESPEFLKITEDSTIQKYIDDGLAYSTYSTMKGGSDDLKYRCQLFGLEIPQPRNSSETPKYYKSYNEFLSYLKQIRTNPLKVIDSSACQTMPNPQSYPLNTEDNAFELDFTSPLHSFSDGIPSMSNLLNAGLKNKAKRDKQQCSMNKNKFKLESFNHTYLVEDNKPKPHQNVPRKATESLKSKAATIIQSAYRGHRVRKRMKSVQNMRYQSSPPNNKNLDLSSNSTPSTQNSNHHNQLKKSSSDINLKPFNNKVFSGNLHFPNTPSILILGGLDPQQDLSQCNDGRSIFRYSADLKKWEKVCFLPRGRYYHNSTFLKGKVYILGGVDPKCEEQRQPCICSDVWSFNPVNCEWTKEASLKTPRKNFGIVSFQGNIYAIGGQGPNDAILSSVEKYDPVKRIWEEVCSLPEPRLSPAVTNFGGTIWVAGGMGSSVKHAMSKQVYSYDYRQNRWVSKQPLRSGKGFSVLIGHEDKLYLVGGVEKDKERGCSVSSNSVEVYDPKQNRWEFFTQMRVSRHSHMSVILENCLYVIGGTTTQQMKSLSDVEIWSFENRAWKHHVAQLPTVLTGHTSILLPAGSQVTR